MQNTFHPTPHIDIKFLDSVVPLDIQLQKIIDLQEATGGPSTLSISLQDDNQDYILDLIRLLQSPEVRVNVLTVRVEQGTHIKMNMEKEFLRVIGASRFLITWNYIGLHPSVDTTPLDLGQLYYVSEEGCCVFDFDYSYALVKAIRSNNIPWMMSFTDTVVDENEMPEPPPIVLTWWKKLLSYVGIKA